MQSGGGYCDRVVYGMLTASLYSTLVGMYLPGRRALFHECQSIQWPSPTYIGDLLTVTGKVRTVDREFGRIEIVAFITNQDGKRVSRAKLVAGVREGDA